VSAAVTLAVMASASTLLAVLMLTSRSAVDQDTGRSFAGLSVLLWVVVGAVVVSSLASGCATVYAAPYPDVPHVYVWEDSACTILNARDMSHEEAEWTCEPCIAGAPLAVVSPEGLCVVYNGEGLTETEIGWLCDAQWWRVADPVVPLGGYMPGCDDHTWNPLYKPLEER